VTISLVAVSRPDNQESGWSKRVEDAVSAPEAQTIRTLQTAGSYRLSHLAGQMVLLLRPRCRSDSSRLPYGTNLCESGTYPFPQGLLIL